MGKTMKCIISEMRARILFKRKTGVDNSPQICDRKCQLIVLPIGSQCGSGKWPVAHSGVQGLNSCQTHKITLKKVILPMGNEQDFLLHFAALTL